MIKAEIIGFDDDFRGICNIENKRVAIKDSLIGDVFDIDITDKKIISINRIKDSIDRIESECIHYSDCGACNKQYIVEDKYLIYKNQILDNILQKLGFPNVLDKPFTVGRYSRRRSSFKVKSGVIGYYRERSHDIFSIKSCFILDESILNTINLIKKWERSILNNITDINISIADYGMDILLFIKREFSQKEIQYIVNFAQKNNIIRLSTNCNNITIPMIVTKIPVLVLGRYMVELPEVNFLQVNKYSQEYITNLIIKHINNISKIADIYSGVGTYSFPLSEFCRVDMFEGNKSMIDSIRKVQNDKIRSFVRNLHNDPLIADELNNYDAVVINPPRNGSSRQIEEIKKSKLNKIFMIYCSHKTFKRDSKILIDSGFVIISANLIDQFYYTDHFEIFAYLQRNKN